MADIHYLNIPEKSAPSADGDFVIITDGRDSGKVKRQSATKFRGPKGDQGERGYQGEQGIPGIQGPKGDRGETGPQGLQGIPGPQGIKGDKGDPFRYSDFTPEQLANLKGPKGDRGEAGPIGPQGPQGLQGPVGPAGPTGAGTGDMLKSEYDADGDNKVDIAKNAEQLGGSPASEYAKKTDIKNIVEVNIDTAANMQQKIGTTISGNYSPNKGDELLLVFEKGSTSSNCLLNIDNSGNKSIKIGASNVTWTTLNLPAGQVGRVRAYYDGESYQIYGSTANHTYQTISQAEALNTGNNLARLVSGEILGVIRDRANHTGTQDISTINGLQGELNSKVSVTAGKGLSTNDYTTDEKNKLAGLNSDEYVKLSGGNIINGRQIVNANDVMMSLISNWDYGLLDISQSSGKKIRIGIESNKASIKTTTSDPIVIGSNNHETIKINHDNSIEINGQNWTNEWQSWTPTMYPYGSNAHIISINHAKYKIIGKTCFFSARIDVNVNNYGAFFAINFPVQAKSWCCITARSFNSTINTRIVGFSATEGAIGFDVIEPSTLPTGNQTFMFSGSFETI